MERWEEYDEQQKPKGDREIATNGVGTAWYINIGE